MNTKTFYQKLKKYGIVANTGYISEEHSYALDVMFRNRFTTGITIPSRSVYHEDICHALGLKFKIIKPTTKSQMKLGSTLTISAAETQKIKTVDKREFRGLITKDMEAMYNVRKAIRAANK